MPCKRYSTHKTGTWLVTHDLCSVTSVTRMWRRSHFPRLTARGASLGARPAYAAAAIAILSVCSEQRRLFA